MKVPKRWRTWRDDFLVRIVSENGKVVRGYDVRFPEAHGFKTRYFGIQRWKTLHEARRQARLHRDELVKAAGEAPRRRAKRGIRIASFQVMPRATNKSGLIGVSTEKGGRNWVAWYNPRPGKQMKKRFSIRMYTNEGARMLAIAWRNEMLAKLRRKP